MLRRMFAAALLSTSLVAACADAEPPRVVAHVAVRSLAGLEELVRGAYEVQGFGAVFAAEDRFAPLRALLPDDVGERPCAIAWVVAEDGTTHCVGVAPHAIERFALDAPRAHGGARELHACVEERAKAEGWLVRAADDEALAIAEVDVDALRAVHGQRLVQSAATVRMAASLTAWLRDATPLRGATPLQDPTPLLDDIARLAQHGVCVLDAWSRAQVRVGIDGSRYALDLELVPAPGSAVERLVRTWAPSQVPRARLAFDGADLEGCVGASDVDLAALACRDGERAGALPEDPLQRLARAGGVFAAEATPGGATLLAPSTDRRVGDPGWPEPWRRAAARCLTPRTAHEDAPSECLFARVRPSPWVARAYASISPRCTAPARAAGGTLELGGRTVDGVLLLELRADAAALAAFVPHLRFG